MANDKPLSFINGALMPAGAAEVEAAVANLAAIADTVRRFSSFERARIIDRIATSISAARDEIARAMAEESGYLTVSDMTLEVQRTIEVLQLTAAYCRVGQDEVINLDAVERAKGAIGLVRRRPIGPILGITAFNGPMLIAAHKIVPAIAAGAPIIIKPAPNVPRAAALFAKHVIDAGWPKEGIGVLAVENEVTVQLIKDPRLPVISFTGGDFGWTIKELAPRKRVHLELGGVGAVLIAADADLETAAEQCTAGAVVRSGQSCISVQRIYVERPAYADFTAKLSRHFSALTAGEVTDARAQVGPLVNETAARRVEDLVIDAVAKGARLVCGGTRRGTVLEPTLLADTTPEMAVLRREAFGPIVAVAPIESLDEGIAEANATGGAIHVGVFTRDIDKALRLADELHAGGVIINGVNTWRVDHMPYGGVGKSGFGREGVRYMIQEFTEPKVLVIRHHRPM